MYELTRKALIICICLLLSKVMHLTASVYVVLFSVVLATASFSSHIVHLLKVLAPSVFATLVAVLINNLFSEHPFIIWTVVLVYFDFVRRRANTNLRIRMATLPLFMIIFITIYFNSSAYHASIPVILRGVISATFLSAVVASAVNHLMPVRIKPPMPQIIEQPVTGADRLKMLVLVGVGLAFIMINEITSAVFCLVPLVTSAMQPTHSTMKNHSREKILSQVGGCSLAIVVSVLWSGTETNLFAYFVVSFLLIYLLLYWSHYAEPGDRAIHADALMGFLIPYQLYVATNGDSYGLQSIFLRAFELVVALLLIYVVAHWLDHIEVTRKQPKPQKPLAS
ncbi:DUF2955 domain-containing protein [Reinekea marinisedimentorum]|uniref:DUF2955 domain-containing protein n=1 Tax=Reinekea marinisedimentorum TaxID=230495 RepID=A0A4R3I7B0_9GAMM|nr:DUF2955 domain-containing protein [Reinekea marinisedimentorum]TCS42026.1 Protein of unknown function (DUF2955) [Reinekea marinisedimentorum]